MSKDVNVVTCKIVEHNGRFRIALEQTLQSGKRVQAGSYTSEATHEEAVERATSQIKAFLMPVKYIDEPLDLELDEANA